MPASAEFATASIERIFVDREARQRRELTNIEELAESIGRLGLLHPIIVNREFILIAGERRLEACRSLGWTAIPYQFYDELNEAERQAVELEENLRRSDLLWQDQVDAIKRYHSLRKANEPAWTFADTADALGESIANISKKIALAAEIEGGNTKAAAAPKLSTALGIVQRKLERARESELAQVLPKAGAAAQIIQADFLEWVETYEGPPFNLIHCDFPYGIDFDKMRRQDTASPMDYADSPEVADRLVNALISNIEKLGDGDCHLMFWFATKFYTKTVSSLEKAFTVNPVPLIWWRNDNSGIMPDPQRGPRQVYETALLCSRGDRKVVQPISNLFPAALDASRHPSMKPKPMLQHFFRMLVDGSTRLLDPTCGSGSAVRAAMASGAQSALGLEINAEYAELAQRALTLELNHAA